MKESEVRICKITDLQLKQDQISKNTNGKRYARLRAGGITNKTLSDGKSNINGQQTRHIDVILDRCSQDQGNGKVT